VTPKSLDVLVIPRADITIGKSKHPSGRSMESFLAQKEAEIQNWNDGTAPTAVSSRSIPLVTTTQRTSRRELHDMAEDQQVTRFCRSRAQSQDSDEWEVRRNRTRMLMYRVEEGQESSSSRGRSRPRQLSPRRPELPTAQTERLGEIHACSMGTRITALNLTRRYHPHSQNPLSCPASEGWSWGVG
jgi:hypothetical protein